MECVEVEIHSEEEKEEMEEGEVEGEGEEQRKKERGDVVWFVCWGGKFAAWHLHGHESAVKSGLKV